jgi:hypothetical protein
MRGKLKARVGLSPRALLREATILTLLQPRKAGLSLEAVMELGPEAREHMKARQAKYWSRPWAEIAADRRLLGGMATRKRR